MEILKKIKQVTSNIFSWSLLITKKETLDIISNKSLENSMNKFFTSIWIQSTFSPKNFINETFSNNSRIMKSLRDFLIDLWYDIEDMRNNRTILQQRNNYIKSFDNKAIFLSRQFNNDTKRKYINHIQNTSDKEFLLEKYYKLYQWKFVNENGIEEKKRAERVWMRCLEDIDRQNLQKIDITTLSERDQNKLKQTFFFKSLFPHFCSHAPLAFKKSWNGEIYNSQTHENEKWFWNPSGIFLFSDTQRLYTKPDQENLSALDLKSNWDESLVAINDFDFLLLHNIYRDRKKISLESLNKKYQKFWTIEEKSWTLFFKRKEEIKTQYPTKNDTKPEWLSNSSEIKKGDDDSPSLLKEIFNTLRDFSQQ
jgi:hypothetical protein